MITATGSEYTQEALNYGERNVYLCSPTLTWPLRLLGKRSPLST